MSDPAVPVPGPPPTQRLFFALFLPPAAAADLHRQGEAIAARHHARVMSTDSLHMTLAFLGAVPGAELPRLLDTAAGVRLGSASLDLDLDRFGYWPHNKILWAGCSQPPESLIRLADTLAAALRAQGFVPDRRGFLPHVTLLRRCESAPPTDAVPGIACTVREFQLVASQPASGDRRYRCVARWPLQ